MSLLVWVGPILDCTIIQSPLLVTDPALMQGFKAFMLKYLSVHSYEVCNPPYLVPVPSQDKLGGLRQEGHLA